MYIILIYIYVCVYVHIEYHRFHWKGTSCLRGGENGLVVPFKTLPTFAFPFVHIVESLTSKFPSIRCFNVQLL